VVKAEAGDWGQNLYGHNFMHICGVTNLLYQHLFANGDNNLSLSWFDVGIAVIAPTTPCLKKVPHVVAYNFVKA